MRKYNIRGLDRDTGEPRNVTLEAKDKDAASSAAADLGVVVSSVAEDRKHFMSLLLGAGIVLGIVSVATPLAVIYWPSDNRSQAGERETGPTIDMSQLGSRMMYRADAHERGTDWSLQEIQNKWPERLGWTWVRLNETDRTTAMQLSGLNPELDWMMVEAFGDPLNFEVILVTTRIDAALDSEQQVIQKLAAAVTMISGVTGLTQEQVSQWVSRCLDDTTPAAEFNIVRNDYSVTLFFVPQGDHMMLLFLIERPDQL